MVIDIVVPLAIVLLFAFATYLGYRLLRDPSPPAQRKLSRRQAKLERYKADLAAKVAMAEAEARKWEAINKTVDPVPVQKAKEAN